MTTDSKKLHSRLEGERNHLLEELAQLKAAGSPSEERRVGSPFGKREEEATESFEFEKRLALEKQTRDHLAEVDHTLQKFEDGTYGLCDACQQPIAPQRLEVLPEASLCMDCKAKNTKGRPTTG